MSCFGRLHSDCCSFLLTDLTDPQHIRVLAKKCTQTSWEIQLACAIELNLVDAREFKFDRIFNRSHMSILTSEIEKHPGKGDGFTRTCGSGDQNQPLGGQQQLVDGVGLTIGQSKA